MVDKNNIAPDPSNVWTAFRLGRVLEFGIREVPHECSDLWPHSMLCSERGMGVAFEDESFKETPIEIVAFVFLDSEVEIVDLRAQLSKMWSYGQVVEYIYGE